MTFQKVQFLHHIYLWGYGGQALPRWFRRAIARSEIHCAWLSGRNGYFVESDIQYGPANPYGLKG